MSDTVSSPSPESRSDQPPADNRFQQASATTAFENQLQPASSPDASQASDTSAKLVQGSPGSDSSAANKGNDSSAANKSGYRPDPLAYAMKPLDVTTSPPTKEQIKQNVEKAEAKEKHDMSQQKAGQQSDGQIAQERSNEDAKADKTTKQGDAAGDKKPDRGETKSSNLEKLAQGGDKLLNAAKNFAEAAKTGTLERASNKIGGAARAIESGSPRIPDAIVKTVDKVVDATQGALFKVAGSEAVQKISGVADKVADGLEKHEKGVALVGAAARYLDARESGLSRAGAGTDALFQTAGDLAKNTLGPGAGQVAAYVLEGGGRGLGIAVDAGTSLATGDQKGLSRLSDSSANAKLGSLPFYGDVAGDLVATRNLGDAVNRITDAAGDGKLGWSGRAGDWIGDHVWSLTHSSR